MEGGWRINLTINNGEAERSKKLLVHNIRPAGGQIGNEWREDRDHLTTGTELHGNNLVYNNYITSEKSNLKFILIIFNISYNML